MLAPLPVPYSGSEKFEVTRGVSGTAGEVGRRERLGGGVCGKYFVLRPAVRWRSKELMASASPSESGKVERVKLRSMRMTG